MIAQYLNRKAATLQYADLLNLLLHPKDHSHARFKAEEISAESEVTIKFLK